MPEEDARYEEMMRRLRLQSTVLQSPIDAIADELGQRINYGDKTLRTITNRLGRLVGNGVRKSQGILERATIPLNTNVLSSLAEQQIALNRMQGYTRPAGRQVVSGGSGTVVTTNLSGGTFTSVPTNGPGTLYNLYVTVDPSARGGHRLTCMPVDFPQPTDYSAMLAQGLPEEQIKRIIIFGGYNNTRLIDMEQTGYCYVNPDIGNPPPPEPPIFPPPEPPVLPPIDPVFPPQPPTPPTPPQPPVLPPIDPLYPPQPPTYPPVFPPACPPTVPVVSCPAPVVACPSPQVIVNVSPGGPGGPVVDFPPTKPVTPPPVQPPIPPTIPGGQGDPNYGLMLGPILYTRPHLDFPSPSLKLEFPLPGSKDYCKAVEMAVKMVGMLGDKILEWFEHDIKLEEVIGGLRGKEDALSAMGLFGGLIPNILNVINNIGKFSEGFFYQIKSMAKLLRETSIAFSPCPPPVLIGICVVRSILDLLKRVRLGTDLGVWLTVDITFDIPQLEKIVDYVANYFCTVEIPEPLLAINAYHLGNLPKDQMECWLKSHGANPGVWESVIKANRQRPTNEQMVIWARRNLYGKEQIEDMLKQRGFTEESERKVMEELSWYIPTISDYIHFIQRNVYDKKYIEDFRLLEDFEEKVWSEFAPDLYKIGMSKRYAEYWYAGHWTNPSPSQLYEMTQRLRPGRVPNEIQFTSTDAMRVMVEQDIAPYFRKRFLQIAYKTFGLRFLRQMYDTYSIDDVELGERFQDIGYSAPDAQILVDSERQTRAWRRSTRTKGWNPTTIAWAVQRGLIDDGNAERLCKELYLTDKEIHDLLEVAKLKGGQQTKEKCKQKAMVGYVAETERLYEIGAITANLMKTTLVGAGYDEDCASVRLATLDLKVKRQNYTQLINAARKAFLRGTMSAEQIINRLVGAGISRERALDYISYWLPDFTPERKKASADKVIRWFEDGLLDESTTIGRLHNLGYDDIDTLLYVAQAKREILEREVKRQQTIEKGISNKQKELEKLAKQAEAQALRIRNELRKMYPVGKLQVWLKKGLISQEQVIAKLRGQGYPEDAIANYVNEVNANGEK